MYLLRQFKLGAPTPTKLLGVFNSAKDAISSVKLSYSELDASFEVVNGPNGEQAIAVFAAAGATFYEVIPVVHYNGVVHL